MGSCDYFHQSVGFLHDPAQGTSETEDSLNAGVGPHSWCSHPRLPKWFSSPEGALVCDGDPGRCPIPASLR